MVRTHSGGRNVLICLCLAAVTTAVYWPVCQFEFINYDDPLYVTGKNPHVQGGVTPKGIVWAFTSTHFSIWMPLTWLSCMLDCQLFTRLNAGAHHLVNVVFHIGNTLLLFAVFSRMTAAPWRSALIGGVVRAPPTSRRISCMGRRTQGRAQYVLLDGHDAGVCAAC